MTKEGRWRPCPEKGGETEASSSIEGKKEEQRENSRGLSNAVMYERK